MEKRTPVMIVSTIMGLDLDSVAVWHLALGATLNEHLR